MQTYNMIIDGKTVSSVNDFEVINPATGATFAKCALGDESTVDLAVAAAQRAFVTWRDVSDEEKVSKVNALASILEQNMPELMELVTKESGKPMGGLNDIGSGMEVGGSIAWTQYTGSLSLSVDSVQDDDSASIEVHRKPLGVVASITPWNWPLMIAIWHVIPAIRAGNTVLIKPSPLTPVATMPVSYTHLTLPTSDLV